MPPPAQNPPVALGALADWDIRLFSKEIIKMGRQARAVVDRLRCKSPVESNAYVHEQERPKADEPDQSGGNGCDCDVGRHDAKPGPPAAAKQEPVALLLGPTSLSHVPTPARHVRHRSPIFWEAEGGIVQA